MTQPRPSPSQHTTSPSIKQDRTLRWLTASTTRGNRVVQSLPDQPNAQDCLAPGHEPPLSPARAWLRVRLSGRLGLGGSRFASGDPIDALAIVFPRFELAARRSRRATPRKASGFRTIGSSSISEVTNPGVRVGFSLSRPDGFRCNVEIDNLPVQFATNSVF